MSVLITTSYTANEFQNKDVINIGTSENCDFRLQLDFDLLLTLEYDEYENDKTENYNDYLEIIKNIEKRISSNQSTPNLISYNSNSNQYLNLKTVDLELVISNSNEHVKKTVPAKNKYLHFKDYGALEDAFEIKAEDLSKGDYVIILDNEKISFIDLFVEIFKLEENINKNLAEYWKDKISIFVEDNNLQQK